MTHQLSMTGDDWLSERDHKARARAEASRRRTGLACAKALRSASEALSTYMMACMDCGDASAPMRDDDGRRLLMNDILEYAAWLESVYERTAA